MALLLVLAAGIAHAQEDVFVEAESFAEKGGWVVDQQFMDQMGSPFLLAHGLGVPVGDAQATVSFPSAATYHVYVRTRDWVPGYGPGQFSLTVAGTVLDTIFGASGDGSWAWKYGGTVTVGAGDAALTIQDLTGFDGRVDAIAFTRTQQAPPDNGPDLLAYRRQMLGLPTTPADAGTFDLVVVGGGMSGIGAAISAARQGLQVALVQNRPVLGGNNSSEVRVHLGGGINLEPLPDVGNIVAEVSPSNGGNAGPAARYEDDKKLSVVSAESNIHLYLNNHVYAAEVDQSRIVAVRARNIETGVETRFPGALFADCTGDGNLGFMAGADYRMGREGQSETGESLAPPTADDMHMGFSNMWYSVNDGMPSTFPECPWALQFSSPYEETNGGWDWESGFYRNVFDEGEHIRDHNLRAVFGAWASYKNDPSTASTVANRSLGWVAYISGKRESRRLMGDYILTEQDIRGGVLHSDGCVFTTWGLDLHYPLAVNECEPECESFRSRFETRRIEPYPIPYRCLYSRNIPNLFMAGRCISVTHVALGTVRVMRTCGMMGEVVGKAAALCREHGIAPRQVYEERLDELFDALGGTPLTMDLVVDDTAAVKTGAWTASSSNQGFYGEGYHHDGNNGKGTKSVQYSLAAPEDGAYKLFMRWSAASNRSSNTPIIV